MKVIAIYLMVACLCASCVRQKGKTSRTLEQIDSLIIVGNNETADSILSKITVNDLKSYGDKAFYYLLKTQTDVTLNHPTTSDSLITFSQKYYERTGDNKKLARAYYYKGAYYYTVNRVEDAIMFIKKAEYIDKKDETPWLRSLIYSNLSFLNSVVGANRTALNYAQKALAHAVKHDDASWRCFAYNCIAISYDGMKMKDSAFAYIKKIEPYLKEIHDKEERAGYLNNIGYVYYENGRYNEAERLFREATTLYPAPNPTVNLIKTYYMLGKESEADSLTDAVWNDADYDLKAELSQFLAERAENNGDYEAATRFYRQAKAMQDSAARQKRTEETVTMQRDYEHEEYTKSVKDKEAMWTVIAVIAAALLAAAGFAYHRKTVNRAKKTIADADRKIKEYTERMAALERQDSKHTNEVKELERKIRRLKDEQAAVINSGQALYNDIVAGGTVATWKKKEFDEFIEYYRICRPEAVENVEKGYNRLSSTHIFYLLLSDMGRDDEEARRILGTTAGAVRTMKSRIRARRAVAS